MSTSIGKFKELEEVELPKAISNGVLGLTKLKSLDKLNLSMRLSRELH